MARPSKISADQTLHIAFEPSAMVVGSSSTISPALKQAQGKWGEGEVRREERHSKLQTSSTSTLDRSF